MEEIRRALPDLFFKDLADKNGLLNPLLERVKNDRTLMLALRGNYINIYYRGGSLLKLSMSSSRTGYTAWFDPNYNKGVKGLVLPASIDGSENLSAWLNAIPALKDWMDLYFGAVSEKLEREFQQAVARENNHSAISNETEYFISDIEYADTDTSAQFDMLAIKWLRKDRRQLDKCRMCLIEMKYGDNAYVGTSGLSQHLLALDKFLRNGVKVESLRLTMQSQFNQLRKLGLVDINQIDDIELSKDRPEVIILLANHHPRKSNLGKILEEVATSEEFAEFRSSPPYDLRFFVASFAGYGLHDACMLSLEEFRKLVAVIEGK